MSDLFGRRDQAFGGALSADSMFMSFGATGFPGAGVGLLVQSVGLQYTQPVRRIWELGPGRGGSQLTYYIVGRTEGQMTIARIVGFNSISTAFYSTYGNPCNQGPTIALQGAAGCQKGGSKLTWTISGVLLTTIGMQASAQEMIIQEQVGAMFISLTIK